ncbi:MAG: hypothetical protein K0R19_3516 [Bacillota bacterium]|jgi:hypothetical protein|nr:hypothetical protein [Bacillota bacterium]
MANNMQIGEGFGILFELNRPERNGQLGGVRGGINFPLLVF